MMKLKLNRKNLVKSIIGMALILVVIVGTFLFFNASDIQFQSDCQAEINSMIDYTQFIKSVKGGDVNDVEIDNSQVKTDQIGKYDVIYKYKKEERKLSVKIVDTKAPEFNVQEKKVALNQTVDPQDLVRDIKDDTETKVSFEKKYSFDKIGTQQVSVIVEDTSGNKTQKTVNVEVVKDEKGPDIIVGNASVVVGSSIDFNALATVKDDFDKNPSLSVEIGDFDNQKKGDYAVKYIAKDASGNQSEKTINVQVIDKTDKNEKVVYLTFDDGPSVHTPEVLDILERYGCKATFFITGMNATYRKYIKTAYDAGHTIGLHTYSHSYSKVYASTDAYFEDLEKIGQLAKEYIGFVPKYIRFPGGSSNTVSKKYTKGIMSQLTKMVTEKGYIYYDWNSENGDGYSKMSQSEMIKRATSSKENQIMILMHDANGKQNTVETLPEIIEYYQKKGYTFKAIDDSSLVPHQHVNN